MPKRELLPVLSEQFRNALDNNFHLFDKHAFRKHEPGQEGRNVLNASLWDIMSTGLSQYPRQLVEERSAEVRKGFYQLLEDGEFVHSITYSSNSVKQVRCRFVKAKAMFEEAFDAYPT